MDSIDITKQLIKIPSWVSNEMNETMVAEILYSYLSNLGIKITKQEVSKNRYNIIGTVGTPRLWLCGHMDTVEPKNPSQLKSKVEGNRLYGLGAADMKAGIAAIIEAISKAKSVNNIGVLFYCDEEYSFLGMKKFLETFEQKADLAIFAEPTNLMLSNAHRGVIEFDAVIKGKTGHASRPSEGVNAITLTVEAINRLSKELSSKYFSRELGTSTCILSKIKGGTQISVEDGNIIYMRGTNSIPDTAEISVDIRPASLNLNSNVVRKILEEKLQSLGCKLESFKINSDFGPLLTNKKDLILVEKAVKSIMGRVDYQDASKTGYGDGQMLFEKTGTPVICFGPSPGAACHKADEYVEIDSIRKTVKVLKNIIETMAEGAESV